MERDSYKFITRFILSLTFCVLVTPSVARADSTCPPTIAVEQKASSPTADSILAKLQRLCKLINGAPP